MGLKQIPVTWRSLLAGVFWVTSGSLLAQQPDPTPIPVTDHSEAHGPVSHWLLGKSRPARMEKSPQDIAGLPWDKVPATFRQDMQKVVSKPMVFSHGPAEVFHGQPGLYHWFLDHPDQAVRVWHRLGAKCMDIQDMGGGLFGWTDGQGTQLHWQTVYQDAHTRLWYAEGSSKPAALLPTFPLRAVVVLRYADEIDGFGYPIIHHQADLYFQTDGRTAALLTHVLGPSVPRLAEQCVTQMEMFFSTLVGYLERHPDRAASLLMAYAPPPAESKSPLSCIPPTIPHK